MLIKEIESAQRLVKTDAYQMSIGEIINMYKDEEFIIHPDFQRLFRWEIGQKAKLIESILLGIPLPSIFVFEKDDSKWELIDGLQRVSTLLEFMGELKDPISKELKAPSILVSTKYLKSLNNVVWEQSDKIIEVPIAEQNALSRQMQLAIKRSRMSVEILKRPSDNSTKYELFQRLNAGGVAANSQELRNCVVIMVNSEYASFIRRLSETDYFLTVLAANDDQIEKQRHVEYVSRFLVHTFIPYDGRLDVEEYIDEGIVTLATANETRLAEETFSKTFNLLRDANGGNALRRLQNNQPTGRVGLVAFEVIAIGIAKNIDHIMRKANPVEFIQQRITEFWANQEFQNLISAGMRGTTRIQRTIPFGNMWFST